MPRKKTNADPSNLLSGSMAYAINVAMADKTHMDGFRLGPDGATIPIYRFVTNGPTQISKSVDLHFTSIEGVLHVTVEAGLVNAHGEQTFKSVAFTLNDVLDLVVCLTQYDTLISVQSRESIHEIVSAINLNYLKAAEE